MRLSSLVIVIAIAAVPFFTFGPFVQPAVAGVGVSSGGHSGGGSVGSSGGASHSGPSASGISHTSGGSSHSSNAATNAGSARFASEGSAARTIPQLSTSGRFASPSRTGLNVRPSLLKTTTGEETKQDPEKKGFFSFFHHKKPEPERVNPFVHRFRCHPGQNCFYRPGCRANYSWYSSYCGVQYDQYSWFGACRSLADQLASERGRIRGAGDSVRYQMLREQYEQCIRRYGQEPFTPYLFMSEFNYP